MPLRYRVLGLLLLGFWLASMTALVRRDLLPELQPPTTANYRDSLGEVEADRPVIDRLALYVAGQRVGYQQSTTTRLASGGYAIEGESSFDIGAVAKGLDIGKSLLGPGASVLNQLTGLAPTIKSTALVSDTFRLERFDIAIELADETHYILGQQVGNKLRLTTTIGGKQEQRELELDSRAMLGGLLFPGRFSKQLKLGHRWEERFVDPFRGKTIVFRKQVVRREKIAVGGAIHETFVVRSEVAGQTPVETWVDDEGRILREMRGFGLRLEREAVPDEDTSQATGDTDEDAGSADNAGNTGNTGNAGNAGNAGDASDSPDAPGDGEGPQEKSR